jgi:hypothetical protein
MRGSFAVPTTADTALEVQPGRSGSSVALSALMSSKNIRKIQALLHKYPINPPQTVKVASILAQPALKSIFYVYITADYLIIDISCGGLFLPAY